MERSREETLSKVNSMGIENLPSQVRLMIHPARILLFPAAFGAWWWSLFLQIALTPVNLPNLLGINLCFPPPLPPLGDMDFLSLLPLVQGLSCFSVGFVLFKLHAIDSLYSFWTSYRHAQMSHWDGASSRSQTTWWPRLWGFRFRRSYLGLGGNPHIKTLLVNPDTQLDLCTSPICLVLKEEKTLVTFVSLSALKKGSKLRITPCLSRAPPLVINSLPWRLPAF